MIDFVQNIYTDKNLHYISNIFTYLCQLCHFALRLISSNSSLVYEKLGGIGLRAWYRCQLGMVIYEDCINNPLSIHYLTLAQDRTLCTFIHPTLHLVAARTILSIINCS